MIDLDDAVTFLLRIKGGRTTPVPMPAHSLPHRGVHLIDPTVPGGGTGASVQLLNLSELIVRVDLTAYQLFQADVCGAVHRLDLSENAEV
ncbi:hypothetical protein OS493_005629 [Desmophyllum pertusum]|uniref:Uncharacterized protein n=1 Tax=Desmophyllum pertusum TaxID=174260 RepID=A0A9X0CPF8_9CNID|nr:hypothetical protein OS493_005629 [Desmophyllum pertusum]